MLKNHNCCGASDPEASERSSSLIDAVRSKSKFLASLWILVVRILYAQLFTNIPLHYHVWDGLCLNLTPIVYICTCYDSANRIQNIY